jgi:tetratricopeptide (TPR) repeat protein
LNRRLLAAPLLLLIILAVGGRHVFAQGPVPVQPTNTPDEILNSAYRTAWDAAASSANTKTFVGNIADSVSSVSWLLGIIRGAATIGGILLILIGILAARAGWLTIVELRNELRKARDDLNTMRTGLHTQSETVRTQANKAIQAISLMQLGEQQVERRNLKGALEMYKQASELDPSNRAAHYFLGELLIQDRQLDKGIAHLQSALSNGHDYAPAEAALGYALRLQGQKASNPDRRDELFAQAEFRMLKALQIDPTVVDVNGESINAVLGGMYKRQDRIQQAIYRYQEALKVTPGKSYPINNLAILYFMEGNLDQALPYFEQTKTASEQVLENRPRDYWARLDHMTALLALGREKEAMTELGAILHQVKSTGPLETALGELIRLKNAPKPPVGIEKAISMMQEAIQKLRTQPVKALPVP